MIKLEGFKARLQMFASCKLFLLRDDVLRRGWRALPHQGQPCSIDVSQPYSTGLGTPTSRYAIRKLRTRLQSLAVTDM